MYKRKYVAENGGKGEGNNCHGKNGADVYISVPLGTVVKDRETGRILCDIYYDGQTHLAVPGGNGGKGNVHFCTSRRRAPHFSQAGEKTEMRKVILELKIIADVGLLGFPNAGKSTFLSAVTSARPKIADYPFTTLYPNLGLTRIDDEEMLIADIPGLIEGAHEGTGLGDKFLRHIERCAVLLHIIDGTQKDVAGAYRAIRKELKLYSPVLEKKPQIIVINKIDALVDEERAAKVREVQKAARKKPLLMSGVSGEGTQAVLRALLPHVLKERAARQENAKANADD